MPYSGKIAINGVNYYGNAKFTFSLQDAKGIYHWQSGSNNNDMINVSVTNGRYSVLLGGQGMIPLPAKLFLDQVELYLKVHFDNRDGKGLRHLDPDQRITATPMALAAEWAKMSQVAEQANSVKPVSVTKSMLNSDVITDLNRSINKEHFHSSIIEHLSPLLKPKIIGSLPDRVSNEGKIITLQAPQSEGARISFQWKKDDVAILGATSSTISVANDVDHNYTVVLSNEFGSATQSMQRRFGRGGISVISAYDHTLFIDENGSLWGMGTNDYGRLGFGEEDHSRSTPEMIIEGNISSIAVGNEHSLVVLENGELWGMGTRSSGALGTTTGVDRHTGSNP